MSSPARVQPYSEPSIASQRHGSVTSSNHTEVGESPHRTDPFSVVICGETGSGKSSLINLIAGTDVAVTSCDAAGCTAGTNMHDISVVRNDTLKVKLIDTAGLDEGTHGTVPDKEARKILKKLLRTLTEQSDIHLVIYCVRGERVIRTLRRNYELIRSQVKGKVPIVLVVTCLESRQPEMEDWWKVNEQTISKLGMTFAGHACITTTTMIGPMLKERRTQSYDAVCKLIEQSHPSNNTGVHTGLSPGAVHHVSSKKAASTKHPNVVVFGQAGAGKSSLINLIAGENLAEISRDMTRCTLKWEEYPVKFGGGSYNIFDTVGLEEPQLGIPQYLDAVENAHNLIQKLERQGGIDLLVFCMRAGRLTATLQSNYRLFNEFLCEKKVPIVVVITHLENEVGEMDAWWKRNKATFRHMEFHVDGHACITAVRGNYPERHKQSRTTIHKLVKEFTADGQKRTWKGGDNLFVSLVQKQIGLLLGKSRSKDIVPRLIKRCGLSSDVAKQLADRINNDVVGAA
ncbi:P-loop containing nucleoside triphosphate hydrolase protein [Suillus fuscotomentosus]|uniref:P-loop containing nucleoside triphosphate hydrolase protein n=1 Tax=Suillus fuscotomentosus TaxID=1912939 RepID=A0AAD4HMY0_9AGAM|nr:P-loop containing nucleoside triphosphate hydrolase protein [Suillus fuscotomentosus]KAG1902382.1 P-loop containing nucleoside triphosphate hydrolase protein [Suillus fuscotomentosus]